MDSALFRADIPITAEYAFLNHASSSPYSDRIADAVQEHVQQMQTAPFDHVIG